MGDFHPLSTQEGRSSRTNFSEGKMTFSDETPAAMAQSPLWWSASSKQHFRKRYLCLWILVALFPFIALRLIFFYGYSIPFQLPASAPISLNAGELLSYGQSRIISKGPPVTQRDVQSTITTQEGTLVRPDEDAWTTHDDWINHSNSPRITRRKSNGPPHKKIPKEKERTEIFRRRHPAISQADNFGLPEDNLKEQPMAWVTAEEELLAIEEIEKEAAMRTKGAEEEAAAVPINEIEKQKTMNAENEIRIEDKNPNVEEQQKKADELREAEEWQAIREHQVAQDREVEEKREEDEQKRTDEQREAHEKRYNDHNSAENVVISDDRMELATAGGECDLFDGTWEDDPEGPLYTNSTCFYIQGAQNCMSNGRPDTDYLHWKWKPRKCDLPRFDAKAFLNSFKGKRIAFVGDSLARNQMQSLLCMLAQVEVPIQTYQSEGDKTVRWLYQQHQVALAVVWSPYLLKETTEGVMGFEKGQSVLYLDVVDANWTSLMPEFDIIVLSTGQWYFKGSVYVLQDAVIGCHYCPTLNLTDVGFYDAYRRGIRQALHKAAADFKGVVVMSTFAISHFEDGTWDTGGHCKRQRPLDEEEGAQFPGLHNDMRDIVMSEYYSIANDTSKVKEDVHLDFLDVTRVSLLRADGHPGPYRRAHPYDGLSPGARVQFDCLHWCLPGPVDTWNQVLAKLLQKYL